MRFPPARQVIAVAMATPELTDAELDRPSIVGVHNFMHNIVLACPNERLGTAVTTLLSAEEPRAKKLLNIPEGFAIAARLSVGYPDPGLAWPTASCRVARSRNLSSSTASAGNP